MTSLIIRNRFVFIATDIRGRTNWCQTKHTIHLWQSQSWITTDTCGRTISLYIYQHRDQQVSKCDETWNILHCQYIFSGSKSWEARHKDNVNLHSTNNGKFTNHKKKTTRAGYVAAVADRLVRCIILQISVSPIIEQFVCTLVYLISSSSATVTSTIRVTYSPVIDW